MIERLWRHDALRGQLQSRIGVVVASAVLLLAGQPATAQESFDFEDPPYTGSPAGTELNTQDGFYNPDPPNSISALVYTYADNALGLPANPGGGKQFAAGTGPAGAVFARSQRDVVYGAGTGAWTTSFDIAVTFIGNLPTTQNVGSFSTQLFPGEATFIALATWTDPATAANWDARYVWYTAAGGQVNEAVDDPGFQNLLIDHWYRWSTTFNLNTNQIVQVSITDLSPGGLTFTNNPEFRYLVGGAGGGSPPPSGFRLFAGSSTVAGNTLALDNVDIALASGTPSGACCFDDETCDFLTEADCTAAGGTYQGDWIGCSENGCITIPEECVDADGSCNETHKTPGCNNPLCCALVCNVDPFCCFVEWDVDCVDAAGNLPECTEVDLPEGFFLDPAEFQAALNKAGKVVKGIEDFSENILGPNGVDGIDDPLDTNSSDADSFPDGILIDNLTFQANTGGVDSSVPAPHTPNTPAEQGLALGTTGFQGMSADGMLANYFVDGFDILSGPPAGDNHTALGLTLTTILGSETVRVDVYDKQNNLLGSATDVPAPVLGGQFLGLIFGKGVTIGRVNIWDPADGAEGVYDVTAYVIDGGECPWDLSVDGDVGIPDLLILLAEWGNPYGIPDLLALLAAWGPCP